MHEPHEPPAAARAARGLRWPGLPVLRVDHLWVLIALALIGVFIALVPTPPNDFWWHLKAGQLVAQAGIPTTNLFAWTLPAAHPYVYATWLGEWLFYALYWLGGLGLVVLARNLLGLLAFGLVALEAWRRSGSWRLAALATLLAGAMTINNLIIRTQNWSWLPFGLYVLILGAYAAGQVGPRMLAVLPVLMAFWVNAHGAFVLGLVLLGIFALGETLRMLGGAPDLGWRRVGPLYLALLATLAATLLNPSGPGIFGYVLTLLGDQSSQELINEWQPPTTESLAGFMFFLSVLALLAALAFARRRPTVTDVLLVCVLLWQAWNGQRYVVWFGMAAMPILAQSLAGPARATRPATPRRSLPNWLIAALLALLLLAFQPPFKAALPLPETYRALFVDLPGAPLAFSATTPVGATGYLRANPRAGRLFNEMGYGSYLDWALYPAAQVFIDPRVELYPLALWQDYIAITRAQGHQALLDKHQIDRVLLDRTLQPALAEALAADQSRWRLEYRDAQSEVYGRR